MQKEKVKTQTPADETFEEVRDRVEKAYEASRLPKSQEYFIRKLAKSGSSRYLSISTILPKDWEAVKIYVENLSPDGCLLKIIPIR